MPVLPLHKNKATVPGKSGIVAFVLAWFFLTLTLGSCSLFKQAKAYERFVHSRFSIRDVKVLSVSGIDVSKMNKYADLDFGQLISLGIQLVKGSLPSVMEITVEGHNTSSEEAAISGMDWLLIMKTDTLARGVINKPITIPPGEYLDFPVKVNFNLSHLIKSGSLEQIMNVVLGNGSREEFQKLGIVFKFKPWYRSGRKVKKSPVYLSIHPAFDHLN